ncbi:MAG TPA: hypothetical protein VGR47_05995 [Terracidiphilus sp.]|nr:hypothetical protein [Terracidiphilus sp.]
MGMVDSELVFGEAQAVTSTGDTPSTNSYDTGGANLGPAGMTGENLWVQGICSTTPTSSGGATIQAVLQDSADNSSFADVAVGPVLPYTAVAAGTQQLAIQPPPNMRRYWRVVWRIGTAALTAGKFDAFITNTYQNNVAQPSGFSVS